MSSVTFAIPGCLISTILSRACCEVIDLRAERLQLRVSAAVIAMVVRVDHVLDRLIRDLLQLRHDVLVVDLELVVHEYHAFVRHQDRGVAGHEVVVNDEQVVLDLDGVELGGLVSELRVHVRAEHGDRNKRGKGRLVCSSEVSWSRNRDVTTGLAAHVLKRGHYDGDVGALAVERDQVHALRRRHVQLPQHRRAPDRDDTSRG